MSGAPLPEQYSGYELILRELKSMRTSFSEETARESIRLELESVCERILENTAVFKTQAETAQFMTEKVGFVYDK